MWFGMWFSWFRQNAKTYWDGPDKMPTKNLIRTKCQPQKKSHGHFVRLAFCPVGILSYHHWRKQKSWYPHNEKKTPGHLVCIVFWLGMGRNGPKMPIFDPKWPKSQFLAKFRRCRAKNPYSFVHLIFFHIYISGQYLFNMLSMNSGDSVEMLLTALTYVHQLTP